MTGLRFFQIDAFAEKPLMGGPAAVIPMQRIGRDGFPEDAVMQAIAAENNLAETAFVVAKGAGEWDLRWFTPAIEVPLCGHATLAAAHAIYAHLDYVGPEIGFDTKSGRLTVRSLPDGRLEMDFPAAPARRIDPPAGLAEALGATPSDVLMANYILAVFDRAEQVRALRPDFAALLSVGEETAYGKGNVICAAPGDNGFDVVSRFFGPGAGMPEDPATGSAHCAIAPYFSARFDKDELNCFQAYPGRGAHITTRVAGDRVKLIGRAQTVIEGVFHI